MKTYFHCYKTNPLIQINNIGQAFDVQQSFFTEIIKKKVEIIHDSYLPSCEFLLAAALLARGESTFTVSNIILVFDLILVLRLDGVEGLSSSWGVSDTILVLD